MVNMAWQSGGNRELLAQAAQDADILLVVEALSDGGRRVERLADILPEGWSTSQDTLSAARAGVAVCWRDSAYTFNGSSVTMMSRQGRGVRARYINAADLTDKATGDRRRYAAFHAPLKSTGRKDEFYRNLAGWLGRHDHAIAGGDTNLAPRMAGERTGRRAIGHEVMTLLLPANIRSGRATTTATSWSDHPIVRASVEPRPAPRRRPLR